MDQTIKEAEKEFLVFKHLALRKLKYGELDKETLERIIEQLYWIGRQIGSCREKQNKER